MKSVGFEPTHPEILRPERSALDRSARTPYRPKKIGRKVGILTQSCVFCNKYNEILPLIAVAHEIHNSERHGFTINV